MIATGAFHQCLHNFLHHDSTRISGTQIIVLELLFVVAETRLGMDSQGNRADQGRGFIQCDFQRHLRVGPQNRAVFLVITAGGGADRKHRLFLLIFQFGQQPVVFIHQLAFDDALGMQVLHLWRQFAFCFTEPLTPALVIHNGLLFRCAFFIMCGRNDLTDIIQLGFLFMKTVTCVIKAGLLLQKTDRQGGKRGLGGHRKNSSSLCCVDSVR
ncbi:hypothetical protein CR62_19845 [Serratia grimesii]|uniref:Uncharacterized protein n=1 Tax=Serratia grimesii TaxID=82995 RepID=A0ABR4U3K6_9GAMM|nr:hypothetical protein CR62_19845 [Serratia grimesii]